MHAWILPLIAAAFERALAATAHASLAIVFVLIAHALLGGRISPRWRCAMWAIVFLRLLLPAVPHGPVSAPDLRPTPMVGPFDAEVTVVTFGSLSSDDGSLALPSARSSLTAAKTQATRQADWLLVGAIAWAG